MGAHLQAQCLGGTSGSMASMLSLCCPSMLSVALE